SIQDIYSSIFIKMFPKKAFLKKILGSVENVDAEVSAMTLGLGGLLSNLGSSLIKEEVDNKKIIILDDLERSIRKNIISIDDILGVINNYIEHEKCKVIVIAHDEKILDELKEKREKVFGQTIKINPDIDSAIACFLCGKNIHEKFPEIETLLKEVYLKSTYSSLRVLKYIINDCERLFNCIVENNLNLKKEQLCYLFHYFIISCIELKSEKLTFDDYMNFFNILVTHYSNNKENNKKPPHILVEILEKYEISTLDNELISKESIVDIISNGHFDKDKIVSYIKKSNYIKDKPNAPSWYKLKEFDKLDTNEIEIALNELHNDFSNRKFELLGEIFHMINLLLLEEKISNTKPNYDKIENECKKYIDDVFIKGTLEKTNPHKYYGFVDSTSYDSVPYWIENDYRSNSNNLRDYLYKRSYELLKKEASTYNPLKRMKTDLDSLINDCTQDGDNYGELCDIPLFHTIPPREFVSTWLTLPNNKQNEIYMMLRRRYSNGKLNSTLMDEEKWINNVLLELDRAASSMEHFHKYRVERLKMHIPTE
ncbi:hypothetical protein Q4R92_10615, partial [Morganella morganii]